MEEKAVLMIYYHLWKEKGSMLPLDPLFLEATEAGDTDPLEMVLCEMPVCLWTFLSSIA